MEWSTRQTQTDKRRGGGGKTQWVVCVVFVKQWVICSRKSSRHESRGAFPFDTNCSKLPPISLTSPSLTVPPSHPILPRPKLHTYIYTYDTYKLVYDFIKAITQLFFGDKAWCDISVSVSWCNLAFLWYIKKIFILTHILERVQANQPIITTTWKIYTRNEGGGGHRSSMGWDSQGTGPGFGATCAHICSCKWQNLTGIHQLVPNHEVRDHSIFINWLVLIIQNQPK